MIQKRPNDLYSQQVCLSPSSIYEIEESSHKSKGKLVQTESCRLRVDKSTSRLAASTDPIVTYFVSQSKGCLEVKCPHECEKRSHRKVNECCLTEVDGIIELYLLHNVTTGNNIEQSLWLYGCCCR